MFAMIIICFVFLFLLCWFSLALQVSVFAKDHFLDALCLQHLLSQVAGENFSLFFSDYTDQVLDGKLVSPKPC